MTEPEFLTILRNNVIWLVVGTGASVLLGLLFAALFDRIRRESLAKTFVFLPLAISLVGASVIWLFVYAFQPAGQPQFGLLNADLDGLRRKARCLADHVPDQPPVRDPDHHLAADRLRDGGPVGRHQGRLRRDPSRRRASTARTSARSSWA